MTKLIGLIMAGNCEQFIDLCIKSVIDQVDKLIICYDSTSKDNTDVHISDWETSYNKGNEYDYKNHKIVTIERPYEHDLKVKNANSNQRNFYLDYLKKNHLGDYCLALDADEVCDENVVKLKDTIKELESYDAVNKVAIVSSPEMVHFIGDLGHEDATREKHYCPNRFFKVTEDLYYPEGEHPVLNSTAETKWCPKIDFFKIYHFAYAREMFYIKDRYLNHLAKSEIHTKDYLQNWCYLHLLGEYPKRKLNVTQLPKVIKEYFKIDDDFFYFQNRGIEMKHLVDAADWKEYFKPKRALVAGDGIGVRTVALRRYGVNAYGFDISKYAVEHNIVGDHYSLGDVVDPNRVINSGPWDFIVAYDLLEHLTEEQLTSALNNCYNALPHLRGHLLVSVPMIGDPNLLNDPTHKIFWTKEQWIEKLEQHGFDIEPTPNHFLYKEQVIIGRKK